VQHPVEPRDVGVQLGLPVVRLDLGGQRVEGQPELLDEGARHVQPVGAGHGRHVRAVGAGGPVELAEVLRRPDALQLTAQPVRQHRKLLAQRGGRGRLPVCAASIGWSRNACARAATSSANNVAAGSHTCWTAPRTMSA
jgi:hypothetical protein